MPGRFYTAVFKDIAVTAVQDFFELTAPSDAAVIVHRITLSQDTEVGDSAEEMLTLTLNRGVSTTSGSGGASVTPQQVGDDDTAFGGTVERNNTTIQSAGTIEELEVCNWNIRMPFDYIPLPEFRPLISPSDRFTVELETAPADSITISGTIYFEEIGG